MGWGKIPKYPYKPGEKVLVSKQATTIDKRILGKVATVKFCTHHLLTVEYEGDVWVFPINQVEKVEE